LTNVVCHFWAWSVLVLARPEGLVFHFRLASGIYSDLSAKTGNMERGYTTHGSSVCTM